VNYLNAHLNTALSMLSPEIQHNYLSRDIYKVRHQQELDILGQYANFVESGDIIHD